MRSPKRVFTLLTLAVITTALPALAVAQPGAERPAGLQPAEPIVCNGMQNIVLRNRYISTSGNAIVLNANCKVDVIDSHIEADGVAVLVASNGTVNIRNSYIRGTRNAFLVTGTGDIIYTGSRIEGPMRKDGTGDLVDAGGNVVQGRSTRQSAAAAGNPAGGDIVVGGVRVGADGSVRVGDGAVVVDQNRVSVGRGTVQVGPGGVVSLPEAQIILEDGWVRIATAGATVESSGDWRDGGTAYDTGGVLTELNAIDADGHISVELAADIMFDFDSAEVRADAAAQLSKVAHLIRERLVGKVSIVGHTDSVGTDDYNEQLSEQRAVRVMQFLNRYEGIPVDIMIGRGAGATQPVAHNTMPDGRDDPAGRARNRRVEIQIATRNGSASTAGRSCLPSGRYRYLFADDREAYYFSGEFTIRVAADSSQIGTRGDFRLDIPSGTYERRGDTFVFTNANGQYTSVGGGEIAYVPSAAYRLAAMSAPVGYQYTDDYGSYRKVSSTSITFVPRRQLDDLVIAEGVCVTYRND